MSVTIYNDENGGKIIVNREKSTTVAKYPNGKICYCEYDDKGRLTYKKFGSVEKWYNPETKECIKYLENGIEVK